MNLNDYNFDFTSYGISNSPRIRNHVAIRIDKNKKRFYITKFALKSMGFPENVHVGIDKTNSALIIVSAKRGSYRVVTTGKQTSKIYSAFLCDNIIKIFDLGDDYSKPIVGKYYKGKNAIVFTLENDMPSGYKSVFDWGEQE